MSELKTLYRHASHYLGGRVCLMLLGFISFPVLTRLFSVAEYGVMSLVLKIVLLMTVLGKFGLQNSVQRFYAEEGGSTEPSVRQRYYSTLFFGALGMGLAVAALYSVVLALLPSVRINPSFRGLLLVGAVLIVLRAVQPSVIGFLRAEGKTKTYNAFEIAMKAGSVALACTLLLAWRGTLTVFFLSTIAVEMLGLLGLSFYFYRRGVLRLAAFDWGRFRSAAIFAFPLIGYELASVVLDSGDRLLVQRYLGPLALGHYSAAYNISTYVEESLMVPINLALFPIYMKLWVEKGQAATSDFLSRSLNNFLALAVLVVCIVLLTSRDIVVVLASKKFQDAHRLLPVLVTGLLIYAVHIFLNAALLVHKRTAIMTGLVAIACGANLVLNVVLLPIMGTQGAAWATLLSYLLLVVTMGAVSLRLLPLKISFSGMVGSLLSAGATFLAIRNLDLHTALLNAVVKGLLALVMYSLLLCLFRPDLRNDLKKRWSSQRDVKEAEAELVAN